MASHIHTYNTYISSPFIPNADATEREDEIVKDLFNIYGETEWNNPARIWSAMELLAGEDWKSNESLIEYSKIVSISTIQGCLGRRFRFLNKSNFVEEALRVRILKEEEEGGGGEEISELKAESKTPPKSETELKADSATEEWEKELKDPEKTGKKFRIANQHFLLTYKTHINKDEYKAWFIQKITKGKEPPFLRMAHEKESSDTNYEHTHVVVDTGVKIDSPSVKFFDWECKVNGIIHPNIKILASREHQLNAKRYLAKEDPANADLKNLKGTLLEGIWACNTVQDALLNYAKRPSDVPGIIAAMQQKTFTWGGKVQEDIITDEESLFPWQKKMWEYISVYQPVKREILWIVDFKCGAGKTEFINWCGSFHDDKVYNLPIGGKLDDILNVLCDSVKAGWCGDTIIINIEKSRCDKDPGILYVLLERLKDGEIFSTKYNGFKIRGKKPAFHVAVFANELPVVNSIAETRWNIQQIVDKNWINITSKVLNGWRGPNHIDSKVVGEVLMGQYNPMGNN